MKQGVLYKINCGLCAENGVQCDYIGESARTSFDRGQDHLRDLRTGDKSNAMVTHMEEDHPDVRREDHRFTMKIMKFHRSSLSRQAHEGHKIAHYRGNKLMNKKGEWGSNLPPVITVEDCNGNVRRSENDADGQPKRKKRRKLEVEVEQVGQDERQGSGEVEYSSQEGQVSQEADQGTLGEQESQEQEHVVPLAVHEEHQDQSSQDHHVEDLDPGQDNGPTGNEQLQDEQHQQDENGVQNERGAPCSTVKLPDLKSQTETSSILENLQSTVLVQSKDDIPQERGQLSIISFLKPSFFTSLQCTDKKKRKKQIKSGRVIKQPQPKSIKGYFVPLKEKPIPIQSLPINSDDTSNPHMNSVCMSSTVKVEGVTVEPLKKGKEEPQVTVEADS